jgi:hypothetical protein
MNFDDYVRSLGLDPLVMSVEQNEALEAAWKAHQAKAAPAPKKGESLDDLVAKARAEEERKAGITALIGTYLAKAPDRIKELEATGRLALDSGWSVKDTEYHLLKACYVSGPMAFTPSQPQINQKVLEASVCRAAGLSRETVERSYSDQVLTAADRHFRGGCGLQRLLTVCAAANGFRDAHVSDLRNLLKAAFANDDSPMASTGFGPSTYSVGGILSNVANKFIIDAFMAEERTWRLITATRPVNDFKQITSYALTGDLTYKKIGPGGEVKHGSFGEEEYTNQADHYGLMLGIDYKQMRNDDLAAFSKLSTRLGRGGALTINDVFWTEFLAGQGTFWSAANGNYYAHADYAFTLEKLGNASAAWDLRTEPAVPPATQGRPMTDEAMFLLVPSALDLLAKKYMRSTKVGEDGGDGEDNPLAGKWTPVKSVYLNNTNFPGYSPSNYFLIGNPAVTPVIETVFLDGQEMPVIETAEPDLSRMGIMIRGTHAFGVRKQEPRGGMKFKQTAD